MEAAVAADTSFGVPIASVSVSPIVGAAVAAATSLAVDSVHAWFLLTAATVGAAVAAAVSGHA